MKPVRWTLHASQNLVDREIERSVAEATLLLPEYTAPDPPGRQILMRRYADTILQKEMLLRVVVEEKATELIVVTVYKTSQIGRYLKGLTP
jgi:hypothetical protein